MRPIKTFTVSPILPQRLQRLYDIANNLWWSWESDARELFRRLDADLWEDTRHNPLLVLSCIDQKILDERDQDDSYVYQLEGVAEKFDQYMQRTPWYKKRNGFIQDLNVAYFSMEYGITECLPIYSGGLGVLAGDHLKSASELGIPLVGVGLLYQKGYFQQTLNIDGWQEEKYPVNDFYNMPLTLEVDENGNPLLVKIPFPDRMVFTRIWKAMVGRVPLYLLDTNIAENSPEDRKITAELYGGDGEIRIQQEIVLGIGGFTALETVGVSQFICHMNEGHPAFSSLENIRKMVLQNGLSFYEALEVAKSSAVFTTHTPVKAGIDIFPSELIEKYFDNYCKEVSICIDELLALGRKNPSDSNEDFSMAILAMKLSSKTNAVSKLHKKVACEMWQSLWPEVLPQEIPIGEVTNGIHHGSWVSREISGLFDRYLGPKWLAEPADKSVWEKVEDIPDGELWGTHERRRERLVAFTRKKLQEQYRNLGKSRSEIARAKSVLNTEALTIGFARRFASYKRATLVLSDPDRLIKLLTNKDFPVQIIFAGKAHPKDEVGKKLIRKIVKLASEEPFRQHIVFLENYDMNIGRYLVQGCDLWLNTPIRGLEACGTSGMKAIANGALHFSTLDGWWDEIYEPGIGWAIGKREEYDDLDYRNEQEANALYEVLEREIIPTFYKRDAALPREWISMIKRSMVEICPIFNTNRMLSEYTSDFYYPSAMRASIMKENDFSIAKDLASWKKRIKKQWDSIRFLNVESGTAGSLSVKSSLFIKAEVYLGGILPDDVDIQIYYGKLDSDRLIKDGKIISMLVEDNSVSKKYIYKGEISSWESGLNGFTIRVIPKHEALAYPLEEGLIHWFEN